MVRDWGGRGAQQATELADRCFVQDWAPMRSENRLLISDLLEDQTRRAHRTLAAIPLRNAASSAVTPLGAAAIAGTACPDSAT